MIILKQTITTQAKNTNLSATFMNHSDWIYMY